MARTPNDLQKEITKTATGAVGYAKTTVDAVQKDLAGTAGDVREAVTKVFLAGLGALAVAEEEGSKTFKKLVKKGEKMELPGVGGERLQAVRAQIGGATDKAGETVKAQIGGARKAADDTADKAEDRIQETVAAVLKRLGVPTREEIAELSASVERLTTHIERLKEERSTGAAAPAASPSNSPVVEAVGGGWYEVRVGDSVLEKVQGKAAAEQALRRAEGAQA